MHRSRTKSFITDQEISRFDQNATYAAVVYNDLQNVIFIYKLGSEKISIIRAHSRNITNVKIFDEYLVVVFENRILIYELDGMKHLYTIRNIAYNDRGIVAVNKEGGDLLIALPPNGKIGEVWVFSLKERRIISWLPAHSSKLAVISFAPSGNLLATASERSAVIKVFNWFTCSKYRTFRRGYNV
ncbi:hypothetical protein ACTXT7_014592 [Hymenolepis weldensis]